MKKVVIWSVALGMALMCCLSCKSRQSAYKAAYEQAKAKEMEEVIVEEVDETPVQPVYVPVEKPKTVATPRQEKITPVAGESETGIKLYSVVVGSFTNKTNAYSLKERMQREGYMPVLGENEQGMLRVILTSHETREAAEESRAEIRRKFAPNFQDAWILERTY